MKVVVIIPAAGLGTLMAAPGAAPAKQFTEIDGVPILIHTLRRFTSLPQITEILVQINRRERMAMVIVEQNVPMVFALTDRCMILEKGRVMTEGTREEVSGSEVMREYLAV